MNAVTGAARDCAFALAVPKQLMQQYVPFAAMPMDFKTLASAYRELLDPLLACGGKLGVSPTPGNQ